MGHFDRENTDSPTIHWNVGGIKIAVIPAMHGVILLAVVVVVVVG